MEFARRIENLPPYLFAEIDAMIDEAKANGVDVISFGIGDPDLPTPEHIVKKAIEAVQNPETHSYPTYTGMRDFRKAVAHFYQRRFNVTLDYDNEVLTLIGSKEGIAHLPWCLINPGDIALVPDPAYPVYNTSIILCGGLPYHVPLTEKNGFLPDIDAIDVQIAKKAKLMFLNYPNNPTGAVATREFFERVISFAYEYEIIIAHDAAYSEITFEGYRAPSILEVSKAKEVAVEFYSLSKTYNMTGWRIGAFVGNPEIVKALGRVKSNVDSGVFEAVQYAGIEALTGPQKVVEDILKVYKERRDLVVKNLRELGCDISVSPATFYLWIPIPDNYTSQEFSRKVFKETGVFLTPGIGYGEWGEGYVRLSLTIGKDRINEAFRRIKDKGIRFK